MTYPDISFTYEYETALAWWQAAGVDCDFTDDATAWLADVTAGTTLLQASTSADAHRAAAATRQSQAPSLTGVATASALAIPSSRRDLLGDSPPGDLAAFRQWWVDAPELDTVRLNPRISPRGERGSSLMVIVPQPEESDSKRLLEGPQGRLLANILAAMGLNDSAVYFASALPCHTPMADLSAIGIGGMDAVLAHHIALAAPQRVLVLGTGLSTYLIPEEDEHLREINQTVVNTPIMVSETLEAMLHMPQLKVRFWKRWIEWSASQ